MIVILRQREYMLKANTIDEVSLEVVTSLYYCG